jgi:hypothetical protein
MSAIIGLVIGILVLVVGYVIYRIGLEILDEGDYFFYAVGFFLLLFVVGGIALYFLLPRPPGQADLGTLAPGRVLNNIMEFANNMYEDPVSAPTQSLSYSGMK